MEMTEKEIVEKYLKNPKKSTISLIADLNGIPEYRIESVLDKAGVLQKKGRPKSGNNSKSEVIIKDKDTKVTKKAEESVESTRSETEPKLKHFPVELIPEAVKSITEAKIRENQAKISYHMNEFDRLTEENGQLMAFLGGEYGEENRIHREVQNQQI